MYRGQEPRSVSGQDQRWAKPPTSRDEKDFQERKGDTMDSSTTTTKRTSTPIATGERATTTTPSRGWRSPIGLRHVLIGLSIALAISFFWGAPPTTVKVDGVVKKLPPSFKLSPIVPIPLIGESIEFQLSPFKFLQRRFEELGRIYYIDLLFHNTIAVAGSEGMKKYYDKEYVIRDGGFPWTFWGATSGHILNMMDNKRHTDRRAAAVKAVGDHKRIQRWMPVIEDKIDHFIARWQTLKTFEWNREIQELMAEIAGIVLLGHPGSEKAIQPLASQTLKGITGIPIPGPFSNWGAARRASKEAQSYYIHLMHDRRNNRTALNDAYDALSVMTKEFLKGVYDSEEGFATEIHHFWMAHTSLVGNIASGMMMHLSKNHHALEKARKEILAKIPQHHGKDSPLSLSELDGLHYVRNVINETRRMDPGTAAMLGRVKKGFELYGYYIPEGWYIAGDFWDTNHDPHEYTKPWNFDPDRFDRGEPKGGLMAWVPHGRAHHECAGLDLAGYLMETFLVHLVKSECSWNLPKQNLDWDLSQFNPELMDLLKVKDFQCGKHGWFRGLKNFLFGKGKDVKESVTEKASETAQRTKDQYEDSAESAYNRAKDTASAKAKDATKAASETLERKVDQTKRSAQGVAEKVKEKTNEAMEDAEEYYYDWKESAEDTLDETRENVKDTYEKVSERIKQTTKEAAKTAGKKVEEAKRSVQGKAADFEQKVERAGSNLKEKAKDTLKEGVKATGYKTGEVIEEAGKTIKKESRKL